MASFWSIDGEDVTQSEIVEQSNNFTPLPENWYQGMVDKIELKDGDYGQSIRAVLSCKVGDDMKKTSVSLKCWDADPKKRKRAVQMLVLMFRTAGKPLPEDGPDEDNIQVLVGRKMGYKLGVYDMTAEDGKQVTGNWLQFVGTAAEAKEKATAHKEVAKPRPKQSDDIPGFDDVDF